MEVRKLTDMVRGWFVGNFNPTVFPTENVEVAVKNYKLGDKEAAHYHKIATEITVVTSGRVRMNEQEFVSGDIIVVSPGEVVEFEALEDSSNVVVKLPAVSEDKYELLSDYRESLLGLVDVNYFLNDLETEGDRA